VIIHTHRVPFFQHSTPSSPLTQGNSAFVIFQRHLQSFLLKDVKAGFNKY